MYSSYRMKTVIRIFKDYDKKRTSCLGAAKCIIFNIYLRRKEIL